MTINLARYLAAVFLAFATTGATAGTYNFDATFDGTNVALDSGSDNPHGAHLLVGDSFTIDLKAADPFFWRVTTALQNALFALDFRATEGTRTVDIVTTWSLDGTEVATQTELGVLQQYLHAGAQSWDLGLGTEFDEVKLVWTLNASDVDTYLIASNPDIFFNLGGFILFFRGGPFNSGKIAYVDPARVPLPAGGLLYLPVVAAGGYVMRRRNRLKA